MESNSLNDSSGRKSTVIRKHSISATDEDKKEAMEAFNSFDPNSDRVDDMIIHKVLADEFFEIKEDFIGSGNTPEDLGRWLEIKRQSRMSLQPGLGKLSFMQPKKEMLKTHEPWALIEEE